MDQANAQPTNRVERLGLLLLNNPVLTAVIFVVVVGIPIVLSLTGAVSWIVKLSLPDLPPLTDPATLDSAVSHASASSERFVHLLSVGLGLTASLVLGLAQAILLLYGFVARHREQMLEMADQATAARASFKDQGDASIAALLTSAKVTVDGAVHEVVREVGLMRSALLPLSQQVASTSAVQSDCIAAATLVGELLQSDSREHRVITRSLIRGFSNRLRSHAKNLSGEGAFLDVDERRELTEELAKATGAYAICMTDLQRIRTGAMTWHLEYLALLERLRSELHAKIPCIFALSDTPSQPALAQAIADLPDTVVPYVVIGLGHATDAMASQHIRWFFELGPLIELFDSSILAALLSRDPKALGTRIAWKSTAFRVRTGRHLTPELSHRITLADAIQFAANQHNQSVWASEDVAKLVRAGVDNGPTSSLHRVLSHVTARVTSPPIPSSRD